MGTTLTAMQSGSIRAKYVVAIEGYKYLLTSGDPAAAVTAWSGTDWSNALGGLYVDLQNSQQASPWEPFAQGGDCKLSLVPDATDQFGIDVHKRAVGAETQITATVDRQATTINVKRTADFAGSGEAFIGTECFAYSSTTSSTFVVSQRGKYSPFAAGTNGSPADGHFAEHHRVGFDAQQVALQPVVSQFPRTWVGKWVGVWLHREVAGVLDTKAQAQLVFAGKIVEIADDPNTGATVVTLKHVLDVARETSLGRDMFKADITEGMWFPAGWTFGWSDANGTTAKTANNLVCVTSGATGTNQFNQGRYTLEQFCVIVNTWLGDEMNASRLNGVYSLIAPYNTTPGGWTPRSRIHWKIGSSVSLSTVVSYSFTLPGSAAAFLGFLGDAVTPNSPGVSSYTVHDQNVQGIDCETISSGAPWRSVIFRRDISNPLNFDLGFQNAVGSIVDQYQLMPTFNGQKPTTSGGLQWGCFLFSNSALIMGAYDPGDPNEITRCFWTPFSLQGNTFAEVSFDDWGYRTDQDGAGPLTIRQIFFLEANFGELLKYFFYGTGTDTYNDQPYDSLGYGLGLAIPGVLLDPAFKASCDAQPGTDKHLLGGDMMLRRSFLRWRNGGLELSTWQTPSASNSIATLTESNKAEPVGNSVEQRSATTETSVWTKPLVKLDFNRDVTDINGQKYQNSLTLEDRVAVDDAGGEGQVFTIQCRNTYSDIAATGAGVEALWPGFLATMPLFSRPIRMTTRSISLALFETLSIGDIVAVNDSFARDPATGRRGITSRPGLITRIRYSLGGPTPSAPTDSAAMVGEVDVFFLDLARIAPYCPAAQVDDTQNAGGFDHGYLAAGPTLRCKAHEHSESSEAADASNFAIGDKVVVVEIDPSNVASPTTWSRIVAGVSGNDITLTVALSSPAWDNTKRYRILSDHFTAAQASQTANAYMDDDATGSVEASAAPYQYATTIPVQSASSPVHTDLPEMPATLSYGDGKARDVGYERGLARLVGHLMDHKTAHQSPMLGDPVANDTYSTGGGFQLCAIAPIYLGKDKPTGQVIRYVYVAPMFRSLDGNARSVRVTLSRVPPTGNTFNDVVMPTPSVSATWTTSSTTYVTGTETAFSVDIKAFDTFISSGHGGVAWLSIECGYQAQCLGLAQVIERERVEI